jgi:hypothetical protein
LPATADYDTLRHRLVLRLGYGMMVASDQTGKLQFARDAEAMLERYATRHELLFGDGPDAEAQRGEVYELLYEVERRIDAPADTQAPSSPARIDDGAPADMHRTVKVPKKKKRELATIDDPLVVARLNSVATDVGTGLVMTKGNHARMHPARGAVKIDGLVGAREPQVLSSAEHRELQTLARAAFVSVRPALRRCYEQAFARTPTDVLRTEVELVLEEDGRVSTAEIVGAAVVDPVGSDCVRDRFTTAQLVDALPPGRVRVRVPLVFYWQPEIVIDEKSGITGRDMEFMFRPVEKDPAAAYEMPPIEGDAAKPKPNFW